MDKQPPIPLAGEQPSALPEADCPINTPEDKKVIKAALGTEFNHLGLEKACESRTYLQNMYLLERAGGTSSHAHSLVYCQAVEELLRLRIPRRAAYIRSLLAELERLQSHLLWLGTIGREIGFDTLFMSAWRDREQVLNVLATLSGNRINYSITTIGGVRRDLDLQQQEQIKQMLNTLQERINYYLQLALKEQGLALRLGGIGRLSQADVRRWGAVGPVARAAGIATDIRAEDPYAAYDEIPLTVITATDADILSCLVVRVQEMLESIKIIHFCLEHLPADGLVVKAPRQVPVGEALSRVEAPFGETICYLRADGTEMPNRLSINSATTANGQTMVQLLSRC